MEGESMQFFKLANIEHKYPKFTYNIHMSDAVFFDTKELKEKPTK